MLDQNNNHDVGIQNVITSCNLVANQNNFNISTKWILTIVYLVALILIGCSTDNIEAKTINIRVANEQSNEAISNAEVLLILEGSAPLTSYTDSQGFVIFELKETDQQRFTVVVTANGYQSYQRNLEGSGLLFEIRLAEQLEGVSNFLLRVIDNTTTRSVSNINATIVVDGKSYTDLTDDSGIVQFSMSIEEHSVSAIVIIEDDNYYPYNDTIIISPNIMQQIEIVPLNTTVEISEKIESTAATITPTLTTQPQLKQLAFSSNRDGDFDIYLLSLDDRSIEQLTENSATDYGPDWSPDGNKIVFHSDMNGNFAIYVLDIETKEITQLTSATYANYWPRWSPDGRQIAFHSNRTGVFQIYVMNADGTEPEQMTFTQSDNFWPVWSPDGTRLVYAFQEGDEVSNLQIIDLASKDSVALTDNNGNDLAPDWSLDGQQIIFHSDRGDGFNIYSISSDGGEPHLLGLQLFDVSGDFSPRWSMDGKQIAFYSNRDGNKEIYVMQANGSQPQRLTDNPSEDRDPTWAP